MDFELTWGKVFEIRQNWKKLIKFYLILKILFLIVLLLTTLKTYETFIYLF